MIRQTTPPGIALLVVLGGLLLIGWVVSMIWPWLIGAAMLVAVWIAARRMGR